MATNCEDPESANSDLNPRASLRQSSYIDPSSGKRLSKTFTLHNFDRVNVSHHTADDTTPLLGQIEEVSARDSGPSHGAWVSKSLECVSRAKQFMLSDTGKGIFKCALAYFVGSLATFVPWLSELFGRQNSKHMVATITVYFHPARSLGSMLDALLLATSAFLYVAVVSLLSMTIAAFFADTVHLIEVGHAIVLVVFVGGGLGLVGWIKLRRNDPLVNIACSLASLSLVTILTKEGAIQAGDYSTKSISQILKMIVAGVIATMLVSFLIFPISARHKLRKNLLQVTDALADMLALITSSFLSGEEAELEDSVFQGIGEQHKKLSSTIPQNLKEARYEHYLLGTERQALIEARLAQCIQRISQSIGGLRSAAAMQFVVIKQPAFGSVQFAAEQTATPRWMDSMESSKVSTGERDLLSFFTPPSPVQGSVRPLSGSLSGPTHPSFRSPAQIFELFIQNLGPSMRSLAFTLKEILDDFPFDASNRYAVATNPKFKASLDRALELYKQSRQESILVVYGQKDMDRSRPIPVQADWEDAAACCGHFSFSLVEVAESVKEYLIILDELQLEVDEHPAGRTWNWLKFWRSPYSQTELAGLDPDFAKLAKRSEELDVKFSDKQLKLSPQQDVPQWPDQPRFKQLFFRYLYAVASFLRRDDVRFAIKVGLGAMLYALPSFIPSTRPLYQHWRGEWGLVSYMLVCSMTIGASNTTGYSRVLGTCLGAALAVAAWEISHDNPFVLCLFGVCMAYWTAYMIIGKGKGPMGRFIMLTYNLSALYAYSLAGRDDEDDGDEEDAAKNPLILAIAGHRVVAVISGCIWGLIITRAVWPISARQKLKDGLALLWLRMGLIWKRDPLATLTEGVPPDRYMNLREEFYLQRFLAKLQGLAEASKSEFELRRPFPHAIYGRILKSTEQMLESFHAMNEVILKDLNTSPGEEALLKATANERAQLCRRISHLFSVLASSMKLEYSITSDALPSIDQTRDRLLAKIFEYRQNDAQEQKTKDEDYSLLYTYALVTGQLSLGIQDVLKEVENLFGVLDEEALRLQ
ncbi:uncharacterized protein Z520_10038 [Fonsecaea multimorphosa CBS 102226]|uniref:Integral membrane bound transporter domain-containing protein n=1 Tax=Fonsecaea multimorphosa CBS 102226 TaxID=1442371 RepID=A0A0D2KC78_9EURO|nr:uncharacterized protein Z520_10038 [Fonsecaea multimorphosa CBS 102226]KIX94328.1 hypothetical protein Z520_10038 [Fonsecaea multimorphosa CBS 102226]OAL19662.1 hypothetical protein AYO22_09534 [Fonsecaea multimorphosa]